MSLFTLHALWPCLWPLLFSLSNSWAKFYQVDQHRVHDAMKGEF